MYEAEATADMVMLPGQRNSSFERVGRPSPQTLSQPEAAPVETDVARHVRTVLAGDRDSFGHLYEMYAPLVHGILLARMPRSEVEDTLQEIFLHALKKLHTLRDANAFGPWIAMIARNRAVDFHRRTHETTELTEDLKSTDATVTRAEEILAVIRQLPDAYHETLVLRLAEGMTGPEIASRTGLTAASVRVNLHRGMKLLRVRLGSEENL